MLINPEKNPEIKEFFNKLYSKISFLQKENRPEFKWSVVMDYILLKSVGNNILRKFLEKEIPTIVAYYMPIILFKQRNESFSETNTVNRRVLKRSLYMMRTDADLKIFFKLFGGGFYPQEQEIVDGTGGLYFTRKDFEGENPNYKSKIAILNSHLKHKKGNWIPCIALNKGHHWVAIQEVLPQNDLLVINNPIGGRQNSKIGRSIPEHYRFYLFDYNPKSAYLLSEEVEDFLDSEIIREQSRKGAFNASTV